MANKTILELTEDTDPVGADVIETQKAGGGAGSSRFATILNFFKKFFDGTIKSPVADSAFAVAFTMNTVNNLATSGAKLLQIKNNGVSELDMYASPSIEDNGGFIPYPDPGGNHPIWMGKEDVRGTIKLGRDGVAGTLLNITSTNKSATISYGSEKIDFSASGNYIAVDSRFVCLGYEGLPKQVNTLQADFNSKRNREGSDIVIKGGPAYDSSTVDRPGGNVYLEGGEPANNGPKGLIVFTDLPTSDPAVAGALWNDTGTLKISAG